MRTAVKPLPINTTAMHAMNLIVIGMCNTEHDSGAYEVELLAILEHRRRHLYFRLEGLPPCLRYFSGSFHRKGKPSQPTMWV